MKAKDLKEKDIPSLQHDLKDQIKHLFDLRTQAITEKLEDPTKIGKTRKDIARIKTVIRQHEIKAAQSVAAK